MKLAHRTIHNAIFNAMGWILPMVLVFLLTPYIVHKMGTDVYGILMLIMTIVGYFTLLDLGLGHAVIKYVAEYNAENSQDKINDVIGATLLIFLILGLIGGVALISIAKLLVTQFLKIPPDHIGLAHHAFCIGSAGFFFTLFVSAFQGIPNGLNRYDITGIVTVIAAATTTAGTAFLLYLGFGLLQVVVLHIAISIMGIMAYAIASKRLMPKIRFAPVLKLSVIKKVLHFGIFSLLGRIAYLVNFQADRIVIGALLGVSLVTYYVIPFMLVMRLITITEKVGFVLFPAISELQGSNRFDIINDLYIKSSRVILAVATSICLPLFVFGDRLLALWMGPDFGEKAGLVIFLLTVALYLSTFTHVPTYVVNGIGLPKISGLAALSCALLNLLLVVPLAIQMGILGVALAFLISNICVTPVFILYVNNKIVKLPLRKLLNESYVKPLLAALLLFLPLVAVRQHQIDSLLLLLIVMVLSGGLYFLVASLVGVFPQQERKVVFDYIRMVMKKA
jgi:O-antigen/teichoic acid export membrane protein